MKDNSIIYEPDFIILNNELLTSLWDRNTPSYRFI